MKSFRQSVGAAGLTLWIVSASFGAEKDAAPPRPSTRKVEDKSQKDYTKDCLRSGCHAQINDGPWVHGPSATGACDACHVSQATEGGGTPAHKFQAAHPKEEACTFCHKLPPAEAVTHAPFQAGDCAACHDPHRGETRQFLRAKTAQELCAQCHDGRRDPTSGKILRDIAKEIARAPVKHGPVATGDCAACHFAHSAPNAHLLAGKFTAEFYVKWSDDAYEFCFRCHDRKLAEEERGVATSFRDGDRSLHFVHVKRDKGRSCAVCHATHAGEHEKLLRDTVPFGPGKWQLPIAFRRTATGGSCRAGCHQELAYDNTKPRAIEPAPPPRSLRPGTKK